MAAEEDAHVWPLQSKLNASLERSHCLEEENEKLKQEVIDLKCEIASLRAKESDKKSIQRKKVQNCISSSSIFAEFSSTTSSAPSKEKLPRAPKPPPRPSSTPTPEIRGNDVTLPPPPPLLRKGRGVSANIAVRRVPELVEFYRYLTRGQDRPGTRSGFSGMPAISNSRDMIGEIENRSSYVLAIKSDVESKGEFIDFLRNEVENAAYEKISDVEAFVKWLDEELSYLVDERAVLKHFPRWPEQKTDAMREAACCYKELKNLESETQSFRDDPHQSTPAALRRIQALQEKLEHRIHNLQRVRDEASKKYKDFKIPWDWMLDTGVISQLKLGSMKLAKLHMARIAAALQSEGSAEDDLILQSVRFAFRVHQFVGGFDEESKHAFQELKQQANKFYL